MATGIIDPMMLQTLKALVTAPGIKHVALGVGVTLASAALNHKLRQAKQDVAIFIVDRIVYVAGGFIMMDLMFRVLSSVHHLIGGGVL